MLYAAADAAGWNLGGWGLAAVGAVLGIVATAWGKVKDVCWRVIGLAVTDADDAEVVGSVEDALGDYLVWIEAFDGELSLCNASAIGEVYAFEPVDMPLNPWALSDVVS